MSVENLIQILSDVLYVLIFLVVALQAVRRPRRATIDSALLFGATALIIIQSWIAQATGAAPTHLVTATIQTLLMSLPFLLLRLVEDFADVPRLLSRGTAGGYVLMALSFYVLPASFITSLVPVYVLYFVGVSAYVARAFIVAGQRSNGVTKRRMQAVALGTAFLGCDLVMAGLHSTSPGLAPVWTALSSLFGLASGGAFFFGFAPPPWLRRAWQEPEVRWFLAGAAHLPRLGDTRTIIHALERGAALSVGVPHATIALWDEADAVLRAEADGVSHEAPAEAFLGGQAFASQRALFWPDATRADPANAERHRRVGAATVMAVPITAGTTRLGVLMVYAPRASLFADDDLMLVQLLADQAAVILESRALITAGTTRLGVLMVYAPRASLFADDDLMLVQLLADQAAVILESRALMTKRRACAREESARLKDDFLSAAAHDLKTPLTTLIAQAQWMERQARRDPTAPADLAGLQRMVTEGKRLNQLVLDLLDVSRVEQGHLVGHRQPVDLVALAREVVQRHASSLHPCRLTGDASVVGNYDDIRLAQVLDNLLDNAIKYSPAGGAVEVRIWEEGDAAQVTVTDQGIGIPATDLPHLFERFRRGQNVDDRRFAGMGLGLYICRGVVDQHGGRIWATSPGLGHGSTMHIVLPLGEIAPTEPRVPGDRDSSTISRVKAETT